MTMRPSFRAQHQTSMKHFHMEWRERRWGWRVSNAYAGSKQFKLNWVFFVDVCCALCFPFDNACIVRHRIMRGRVGEWAKIVWGRPASIWFSFTIQANSCVWVSETEAGALSTVVLVAHLQWTINWNVSAHTSIGFSSPLVTCHYHFIIISYCRSAMHYCRSLIFDSILSLSELHFPVSTLDTEHRLNNMKFIETLFAYLLIATFDIVVRPERTRPHDTLPSSRLFCRSLHRTFIHAKCTRPPQTFNEFSNYIVFV